MKLLLYLMILTIPLGVLAQQKSNRLDFSVKLNKVKYLVGEPIWVKVVLKNSGQVPIKTLLIDSPTVIWKRALTISLKDLNGNEIDSCIPIGDGSNSVILEPQDSTYDYFDLLDWYGESLNWILSKGIRRFLKPGGYLVRINLHSFEEEFTSNELRFDIQIPKSDMQKSYDLYKNALKSWFIKKDQANAITMVKKAIKLYPKAVYTDLNYNLLYTLYFVGNHDYDSAFVTVKELILNYPQSPFSLKRLESIPTCLINLKQTERIDSELKIIAKLNKSINPEISERATSLIGKYK